MQPSRECMPEPLALALSEQLHIEPDSIELRRVTLRPWSQIYQVLLHKHLGSECVIVKRNGKLEAPPSHNEKQRTVSEFKLMKAIHDDIRAAEGCFIPRPIAILEKQAALVIEFVDGVVLSSKTRFANYFADGKEFHRLIDAYRLIGRWLRRFQEITTAEPQPGHLAVGAIRERIYTRLHVLTSSDNPELPSKLATDLRRLVDALTGDLQGIEIPMVGRHSDFGPWNMIVNEGRLTVLDFHDYKLGPPPEDVMKIVVHLERSSRYLASSRSRYERLLQAFLRGYGRLDAAPAALITLLEVMERLQFVTGRLRNKRPSGLYRRVEWQRDLQRHIRKLQRLPSGGVSWNELRRKADCLE